MKRALLVTASEKSRYKLADSIHAALRVELALAASGQEARYLARQQDYAVVLVSTPLPDEFGHQLAQMFAAESQAGVVLLSKAEQFDEVAEQLAAAGVLALAKPVPKRLLHQALKLALATHTRLRGLEKEAHRLQRSIDDVKIVEKAKYVLMQHLHMSEPTAHAFIEKQAMNMRVSKREVAEGIIRTYVN